MLPGLGGTLFPLRYLADGVLKDAARHALTGEPEQVERIRRRFIKWWDSVAAQTGPASGLRTLFDLVAMPLFGMLGYRAPHVTFDTGQARACLLTPAGERMGLVLTTWAARPPGIWRDLVHASRSADAAWCFVLAPPFLSLVEVRGRATRHSLDISLPAAFRPESFERFLLLAEAAAFDSPAGQRAPMEVLLRLAASYQDRVRTDLQQGVLRALGVLGARGAVGMSESLVIVYRILFLLFAEARHLVPESHPVYRRAYSVSRLAQEALAPGSSRGLWDALAAITRLSRLGCRTDDLIVRPFNGQLFARRAAPSLEPRRVTARPGRRQGVRDDALREVLVALGSRESAHGREMITYADLGVEQLGAVYEHILDLEPAASRRAGRHSDVRKRTGTFYTPQALAEFVVRRTLAPLVAGVPSDRILDLRVVDPAMGSGAFLVAACSFLARAYERALIVEGRLSPGDVDTATRAVMRRLIAERCLAGVDVNPVAAQLARLSLWLATLAHGRPLSFLDHRLRTGNSLIGASPDDLWRTPGPGKPSTELPLFGDESLEYALRDIVRPLAALAGLPDDTLAGVHAKETLWERLSDTRSPLARWRVAADVWCAQWFDEPGLGPATPGELRAVIDSVLREDSTLPSAHLARRLAAAHEARRTHGFFHWPLEFADVFYDNAGRTRSSAGFDAVIGNPPWEVLRQDQRQLTRFVRESGIYEASGRGHLNVYQPFVERALSLCRRGGRVGLIVPWGIAADEGSAPLRRRLLNGPLETLVGLDNARGLFPIHRGMRFAIIVAQPGRVAGDTRALFGVRTSDELDALPGRDDPRDTAYPIRFTGAQVRRMSGPSERIPDVRDARDLALLEHVTALFPAFGSAQGWAGRFGRELNASEDRRSFGSTGLPIVDGKHLEPFRVDVARSTRRILPAEAARLLPQRSYEQARLAYRDVSSVGNKRSLIAAIVPAGVVTTHTIFCLRAPREREAALYLCGVLNSMVMNQLVRMLMGGHVTTSLAEQLPIQRWNGTAGQRRVACLASHLSDPAAKSKMTAWAALEAEVACLYELDADELERIAGRFPLVEKTMRDEAVRRLRRMAARRSRSASDALNETGATRSVPSGS